MEPWLKLSLLLCVVGFLMGIAPSEHFLFQYLTEFRDIPEDVVTNQVLPQLSYWMSGCLLFFLLITDIVRYKPVIITAALAAIFGFTTLRWTQGEKWLTVSGHVLELKIFFFNS